MNRKLEIGQRLFAKGEVKRAFKILNTIADRDPAAYLQFAHCYADGVGVEIDDRKAFRYRDMSRDVDKKNRQRHRRAERFFRQNLEWGVCRSGHKIPSACAIEISMALCRDRLKENRKVAISFRHKLERQNGYVSQRRYRSAESAANRVLGSLDHRFRAAGGGFDDLVAAL